jgi:hypothetical protein
MSYHYGQAPNQPTGLPFMYQPSSARPQVNPSAQFGYSGYTSSLVGHGNETHRNVYQNLPPAHSHVQGAINVENRSERDSRSGFPNFQTYSSPVEPGIRSAAEIYPSHAWAGHTGDVGSRPFGAQVSFGKGTRTMGKGRGKPWTPHTSGGQSIGKAANAIPLGKTRVFLTTAETSTESTEKPMERPRSPHRPLRVVGRGRALTVPAWAKEKAFAPGEKRTEQMREGYDRHEGEEPVSSESRPLSRGNSRGPSRHSSRERDRNRSDRSEHDGRGSSRRERQTRDDRDDRYERSRRRSRSPRSRRDSPPRSRRNSPGRYRRRSPDYRR